MFKKVKSTLSTVMGGISSIPHPQNTPSQTQQLEVKYPYSRPFFLNLTNDEVQMSADHTVRPLLVPRNITKLPWCAGYSETINSGKTVLNEDQGVGLQFNIKPPYHQQQSEDDIDIDDGPTVKYISLTDTNSQANSDTQDTEGGLPVTYFAIFDGHAGTGAALMAAHVLHVHIKDKLMSVYDRLVSSESSSSDSSPDQFKPPANRVMSGMFDRKLSKDDMIRGALESAFWEMDDQIARERSTYRIKGGCAALVALCVDGKIYVANAGDCRAILIKDGEVTPMSMDFTPESDRQRLQYLAYLQPELLKNDFTALQFLRRVHAKDIGKMVLYRDHHMTGWAYKKVCRSDTKFPLIVGEGKRARVLATIGVTRGFGDHDLRVYDSDIFVKPFLTPVPEVRVYDAGDEPLSHDDVLVMASDGLWDVLSNERVAIIIEEIFNNFDKTDASRYTTAAQELVMQARGHPMKNRTWRNRDNTLSSNDDISVFVIPLDKLVGPMKSSDTRTVIGH